MLSKVQLQGDVKTPLRRMVVRVQFTPTIVRYLYIRDEDFFSAIFYVTESYCVSNRDAEAYLLFEIEPGEVFYVEPEEFSVLAVTDKNEETEEGIFTMFKSRHSYLDGVPGDILVTEYVKGSPDLSNAAIDTDRYTPMLATYLSATTPTLPTKKRGHPPKVKDAEPKRTISEDTHNDEALPNPDPDSGGVAVTDQSNSKADAPTPANRSGVIAI
jgi:hypothetical protein